MEQSNYTEEMIEEAKAYLRDRLRNQQSMSRRIEELLTLYAEYLLNALFNSLGGSVENDIELLVNDLIEQILSDCETLVVDEHNRRELVLAYINRDVAGDNLRGRVTERVRTYANEVMAVYVGGKAIGENYDTMLSSIKSNLNDPWNNPILVTAREKVEKGEITIPDDVDIDEPSYGQGIAISSLKALNLMTEYAIAEGWQHYAWLDAKDKGAKGYYRVRMSQYACELCDSLCGIFYPITDEEHKGLAHPNCVCGIIYSYVERL